MSAYIIKELMEVDYEISNIILTNMVIIDLGEYTIPLYYDQDEE